MTWFGFDLTNAKKSDCVRLILLYRFRYRKEVLEVIHPYISCKMLHYVVSESFTATITCPGKIDGLNYCLLIGNFTVVASVDHRGRLAAVNIRMTIITVSKE